MAVDFKLMNELEHVFPTNEQHDKHNFDKDFNNFIVKEDMLTMLANKAQAEGKLDKFLSYADDHVGAVIDKACADKKFLSVAIEDAYLLESFKAKLDGNKFF